MIRSHILLATAIATFALCSSPSSFAQESKDNDPHIKPREGATPAPSRPQRSPQAQPQPTPPALETEEVGDSSSKDAQIDLNVRAASRDKGGSSLSDDPGNSVFDPHRAMKDIEVGDYYLKQKNYRAALDRYSDALLYKPGDAEATYGLAVTQDRLSLPTQAYKNYKKYLEILPSGDKAKEAQEAIKRLTPMVDAATAASEQARQAAHLMQAGEGFLAANKYDDALEQFENALRLTPDNPVIHFRLGQSLRGMERLEPARLHFRKYLELEPNGPYAADAKKAISDINYTVGK